MLRHVLLYRNCICIAEYDSTFCSDWKSFPLFYVYFACERSVIRLLIEYNGVRKVVVFIMTFRVVNVICY